MPRLPDPPAAEVRRCVERLDSLLALIPVSAQMLELAPADGLLTWKLSREADDLIDRAYAASALFDGFT